MKRIVRLTERDLSRIVKRVINETKGEYNIDLSETILNAKENGVSVTDETGKEFSLGGYADSFGKSILKIRPSRFSNEEIITIKIPGLHCERAKMSQKKRNVEIECNGEEISFEAGLLLETNLEWVTIMVDGNVFPGDSYINLDMTGSSIRIESNTNPGVSDWGREW